jgi:hypothetical protein
MLWNPFGSRPAVTHKSGDGPVNIVQVHPTSLAEWQKQIEIAILGQIGHCEFSEIEARLQRDLDYSSDHGVGGVDYRGGSKESHPV